MNLLFGFALCMVAITAKGQSRFGLKAGLNLAIQSRTYATVLMAPAKGNSSFLGYQFGVFSKTKLSGDLSFAAETNFSVIGSSSTHTSSITETYNTKEKLGYIEVPLTLQLSFGKFYLGAGPGFSFKIFSKLSGFENRTFNLSGYKSFDAAGNVVAGYSMLKKLDVNVRYSHGFTNVSEQPGLTVRNRFFNLSVLYYFK